MKFLKYLASIIAAALLLCAAVFAKDLNSGSFDLTESDVKVSIVQHGKTVATTDGTLKQLPAKSSVDSVTFKTMQDNSRRVDEIDFNNRSEALVLSGM